MSLLDQAAGPGPRLTALHALRRFLLYGLGVASAAAPLVMVRDGFDPGNLPQSAFIQMSAFLLVTLWLVRGHLAGHYSVPLVPFGLPLLTLLAWSALSLLWARNRYEGIVVLVHWAACAAIGLVVADLVRDAREVRSLLLCLFAGGVAVAILGMLQHVYGVTWVPQAFAPAATFVNRNIAAQFTVMVVPLGMALLLGAATSLEAGLLALGTALMLSFLFCTRTRSAWLALLAEAALMLLWMRRAGLSPRRVWPRALTVLAASVVLLGLTQLMRFGTDFGAGEAYDRMSAVWRALSGPARPLTETGTPIAPAPASVASVHGRLAIWRNTLEMTKDFPLQGVGLGNHPISYPLYARRAVVDPLFSTRMQLDYAHNEYLQLAAELGLVGLGLAAWLAFTLLRTISRGAHGDLACAMPYVPMGLAAGLTGVLVDGFFSFPFRRALPPLLVMIDLGLLIALARAAASEPSPVSDCRLEPPRWLSLAASLAGLVGLAAMAWLQYNWIQSDKLCLRMLQAEARRDWPTMRGEAESAHRHNPYRKEPLFAIGSAALETRDPGGAAGALERLLESNPNDLNALANLGLAYSRMNEPRKALECYRTAATLEPEEALLNFRMAEMLDAVGDADAALAAYRLAARYDPRTRFYQYQWGLAALRRRSYAEAEEALGKALALDPESAASHKALGVLLAEVLGRRQEGVEHLRQALALDERIPDRERMRQIVESYDREVVRPR